MSPGVHIVNTSRISLPRPSPPVKLSFFDCIWVPFHHIQRIILYPNPATDLPFDSLVAALKSSLAAALLDFRTLAGKLAYNPATGDVEIDCSDTDNIVSLIEAESDLDIHRLAESDVHDVEAFVQLVPSFDVGVLPFPAFAVQVTRFVGGGVSVGYAAHHAVGDGKAMLQFVNAWAGLCRAAIGGAVVASEGCPKPTYDRAVIGHPRREEFTREFLRRIAPTLPSTKVTFLPEVKETRARCRRRTFVLDAAAIQSLRRRGAQPEEPRQPSTFAAIAGHVWSCIFRTKSMDADEEAVFLFLMDCRTRLHPPITADYFGNCVRLVFARMPVGDLVGEQGHVGACAAIRKAIDDIRDNPISDTDNWAAELDAIPYGRMVNATASPRFRVYDADFGWGRPARFESVSMNLDGEVALVAGREEGSVQVSVSLDPSRMGRFADGFLAGVQV